MEYYDSIVVAVTGGMGSGQTTVAKMLEKLGARTINADLVAKKVIDEDPEVRQELIKAFGKKIFYPNGKLKRKMLARIVFEDEAKTQRLNRIVHPRMVSRIIDEIESIRETHRYPIIVVDAALIYELNLEHMFDAVIVVSSKMSNRIQRIKERDKLTEKEIIDRISKQIPIEDKMKWADFVIENNGTLEDLERKVKAVYQKLLKLHQRKMRNKKRSAVPSAELSQK